MTTELEELGHHFTWNFLKLLRTKANITNMKIRLEGEHENEPYARRHALMNLLGFLEVELGQLMKGQKLFETILEEDVENYNALQNLYYIVFEKKGLRNHPKALQCKKKIDDLPKNTNSNIFQIVKARALYEKATAMSLTDQSYLNKDHEIAVKCFTDALSIGEKVLKIHEINDWLLSFGFLYQKMDSQYHRYTPEYFKEGMKLFYKVACVDVSQHLEQDDTRTGAHVDRYLKLMAVRQCDIKAKAWAFMGRLLGRRPESNTLSAILEGDDLKPEHKDFDYLQCLEKAVELTPMCATVVRRLAQGYLKRGDFDKSWKLFEKAKLLKPSDGYTYSLIGKWFLKKFKTTEPSDQNLLSEAIVQFQQALDMNCDLVELFTNFAEAHMLNKNYDDAVAMCCQGSGVPGGDRFVVLYELWANILREMGDEEGAKEKVKYAKKLEISIKSVEKSDFGVIYSSKDTDIVKEAVNETEKRFDVKGYYFERDCLPGSDIIFEYGEIEQNCTIIMMFVSENFCKSPTCQHEMTEILQMRVEKALADTVIPVLIGSIDFKSLPPGLKSRHGVKYQSAEYLHKMKLLFKQ